MILTRGFWRCFLAVFSQADHCLRPRFHRTSEDLQSAYKIVMLWLSGALFYHFFAVFPSPSPFDRKLPWLKYVLLGLAKSPEFPTGFVAWLRAGPCRCTWILTCPPPPQRLGFSQGKYPRLTARLGPAPE
jgi:hypothetical protein